MWGDQGELEPIPDGIGCEVGYTPDKRLHLTLVRAGDQEMWLNYNDPWSNLFWGLIRGTILWGIKSHSYDNVDSQ